VTRWLPSTAQANGAVIDAGLECRRGTRGACGKQPTRDRASARTSSESDGQCRVVETVPAAGLRGRACWVFPNLLARVLTVPGRRSSSDFEADHSAPRDAQRHAPVPQTI
jgi:hypothetical protein